MLKLGRFWGPIKAKYKSCLLNLLILLVTIGLMLVLAEIGLRWIDGYRLSTLRLDRSQATVQPLE